MPDRTAESIFETFLDDLAPLALEVTAFGGLVVGLHLDALPDGEDARETTDVDCVPVLIERELEMGILELRLHALGWTPHITKADGTQKNLIFAKVSPSGIEVDFVPWFLMPDSDAVRICGVETLNYRLPSGRLLRMLTAAGSLATKLAAFHDRGVTDPYSSSDLEDIALLLVGCSSLEESVQTSSPAIRELIASGARLLLSNRKTEEALEGHIPRGCDEHRAFALLEQWAELS